MERGKLLTNEAMVDHYQHTSIGERVSVKLKCKEVNKDKRLAHFHLLPFVNNKQYGEGEMIQSVVFLYVFAFNFALTLSPQEVC